MNDLFAAPGIDGGYTGMSQDDWNNLASTSLMDVDLSDIPDVVAFKPQS